jgi:hypothetical protein
MYLDAKKYDKVFDQLPKEFPQQDRKFQTIHKLHFDFEMM